MNKLAESRTERFEAAFADFRALLLNWLVFFLFCGINTHAAECESYDDYDKKENRNLIHVYSPVLLNKIPIIKRTVKTATPRIKARFVMLSGVTILPMITAIKSAWQRLRKILANSFRWFLSKFIYLDSIKSENFCQDGRWTHE
ncbi:MAG: hypothetical protein CVU78_00500 [Elusimicrobia bacterium HGW-Elusimicrobia-2]|nr:MAG: hypothetical protein CVU78_00500 [Elusimicrobia bacterium HGW-Elusimicrobia-2]